MSSLLRATINPLVRSIPPTRTPFVFIRARSFTRFEISCSTIHDTQVALVAFIVYAIVVTYTVVVVEPIATGRAATF
jgi:hypothetical protein